jgi:hypothetical protein
VRRALATLAERGLVRAERGSGTYVETGRLAYPLRSRTRFSEIVGAGGREPRGVGGDGAPFNLGEATVSRAAVRLSTGEVGFGYTLGRDREKARLIALCDAMVQSPEFGAAVEAQVVAPLRAAMIERRNRKAAETAATRVDFYTLVRGES